MPIYRKKKHRKQNLIVWSILVGIFLTGALLGGIVVAMCIPTAAQTVDEPNSVSVSQNDRTEPLRASESVSEMICTEPLGKAEYKAFTATAYCGCKSCCGKWAENRPDGKVIGAAGIELKQGVSIAADFDVLPIGTVVEVKGLGTYTVQDTGSAITGNKIDIYFSNHEDAVEFGVQTVYLRVVQK